MKKSNFFSFLVVYKAKKQLVHVCTYSSLESTLKRLKKIYRNKQIISV